MFHVPHEVPSTTCPYSPFHDQCPRRVAASSSPYALPEIVAADPGPPLAALGPRQPQTPPRKEIAAPAAAAAIAIAAITVADVANDNDDDPEWDDFCDNYHEDAPTDDVEKIDAQHKMSELVYDVMKVTKVKVEEPFYEREESIERRARRHVFEKVKGKAFQTRITQYLIRNAPWRVGDGNEPFARDDVGRFSFIEYHFLELGPYGRFYKEFPSDDERPLASPKAEESDEAPDHEA